MTVYDVVIVGSGPGGLAAAIYTGRARLRTIILEKGIPGGQILLTDWIENYPGFSEGIAPFTLMDDFRKQAEKFGAKIKTDEVLGLEQNKDIWALQCRENIYQTRAVIIATGSYHRKLGVAGEKELSGRGVSYCATCDGPFYRDKVVGIVGGGSFALTEALYLTKFCKEVKIIHRRDQFRAEKILQERVRQNTKISLQLDAVIEKINGKDQLESVILRNVKNDNTTELALGGLFVAIGMLPNTGFIKDIITLNKAGEIKAGKKMSTSQPGIYAAGDVTDLCSNQVATAVGSGVEAGIAVDKYLSGM